MKKYYAEMVGTFVLTFLGCGTAVALGCGSDTASVVGTAMAFGLAVIAMAYTIGGISGCHINPAITLGQFLTGRMNSKDAGMYIVFQVIGAVLAALVLFLIVKTAGLITLDDVKALQEAGDTEALDKLKEAGNVVTTTTTGANSCSYGVFNGLLVEIVLTALFVLVVLGTTSKTNGATNNFAGLAIGLSLILIHLVGIRFTGTSVNPARSIGPALFAGGDALKHIWVFIIGPFAGGALAAAIWKFIHPDKQQ